ncbi:EAL domain-containing protein [Aliikangiella sp. G2MR2-5]|uniref:EAL domain-containing protein n=1 Tax=Aliikangiella sp. G2MR2-5 TaxID=2788943 RepID=UPI0018AB628D|nr:EAL domain-containing protein [Aliikangiella sp. G2MR2-5]
MVKLKQLSTEDGLNQSNISGLLVDDEGYLWISSLQGLNRYDGYRIRKISSPGDVLLNNFTESPHQDSTGKIWVGAAPHENFILDKKQNSLNPFSFPDPPDFKLEFPILTELVEDRHTNLWLTTYYEVFYYHRNSNKFEYIDTINNWFDNPDKQFIIRALLLLEDQLLVGTTVGLYSLDLSSKKVRKIIHTPDESDVRDQNDVKVLTLDRLGRVLVGTVEGLYAIQLTDLQSSEPKKGPLGKSIVKERNIWQVIEKPQFYWLATDLGLFKLNKTGELKHLLQLSKTPFAISDDDINVMVEDKEGVLWMGTRGEGVFKWKPNPAIKQYYSKDGPASKSLSHDQVLTVKETENGELLVGTQNGLNLVDLESRNVESFLINPDEKQVVSSSTIYEIALSENEIWLNTGKGLKVVNRETKSLSNKIFDEKTQEILKKPFGGLRFVDEKTLLFSNLDGTYLLNTETNQVSMVESSKTNGDRTKTLGLLFDTATGERSTYFASGYNRLVKYDHDSGQISSFHELPPSESYISSPADVYREGDKLWVTYTGLGLFILDANNGEELKFFKEEELGVNTIMDIFPDNHGNLWITTNTGLLRINKLNYNAKVVDKNDGFATSEFMGGASTRLSNGDIALGSLKGLSIFSPNLMTSRVQREVTNKITNLSVLSKKMGSRYGDFNNTELTLEYNDFGVKIELSALLLDKPEQIKYRYWIEGAANIKPILTKESELFFPSIATGESILYVTAIDYETGAESKPAVLKIHSKPAPWLSRQAFASYILLSILIFWFNYHRYKKRAEAKAAAHQKIMQSEERLSLALQGSNSGLWDWHAISNVIYEPRLQNDGDEEEEEISFEERIQAIHEDDREKFLTAWATFLLQDKSQFDITYRLKNKKGEWAWYRDMATVTEIDEQRRPIRVTGTYTDFTERKEARDKMRLFSNAFENTRDIVFVLNHEKNVIAANSSFYKRTEYENSLVIGKPMKFLTDEQGNRKIIASLFKQIYLQSHWEGEGLLTRNFKRPLPVLINATSFKDNEGKEHFVFALTDISKQKQAENELRKLANYDALTGLPNRALLLDRITHAIEHCRRRSQKLALFFIDLDRFKQINDTLGHDVGDLLLINVAQILRKAIRQDDTVARLGGDEFVVMLEDIDHIDSINRIAQNIIEKMQEPMLLRENQISVSPSIGISTYPTDGDDAQQLLKNADIAMYHAKNAGRNNFQYFENSMNHAAKERLSLENQIRTGVSNHEFYLVYQPQICLKTRKIIGMEALARWKNSEGQYIAPSEFIPIAEEIGLIIPITEYLLDKAFTDLAKWHQKGLKIGMAFNLSARHLHHYDFNSFIELLIKKHSVKTELIEFELTESILMKDMEKANRIFGKLSEKGIDLALDDFGTGYSSLKYLNQLPIKKLKIDRSFVQKVGLSQENNAIINTIVSLAKSLNLKTVAEGIETQEQLKFMHNAGVEHAQGFLFAKPMPIEEVEKLLNKTFEII